MIINVIVIIVSLNNDRECLLHCVCVFVLVGVLYSFFGGPGNHLQNKSAPFAYYLLFYRIQLRCNDEPLAANLCCDTGVQRAPV